MTTQPSGLDKSKDKTKLNLSRFLEKSYAKFGSKFDYSKVVNIENNSSFVEIGCPLHGFFKVKAHLHFKSKNGCGKCGSNTYHTLSEYLEAVESKTPKHTEKFKYNSNTFGTKLPFIDITCRKCGFEFSQRITQHKNGAGCRACMRDADKYTKETWLEAVLKRNPDFLIKYDYSETVYNLSGQPLTIYCRGCGEYFTCKGNSHQQGVGCRICSYKKTGGVNIKQVLRNPELSKNTVYDIYLLRSETADKFYKIGVSNNAVKRHKEIKSEVPVELILWLQTSKYNAIILEDLCHKMLWNRHASTIKFAGYTECFNLTDEEATEIWEMISYYDSQPQKVEEYVKHYLSTNKL